MPNRFIKESIWSSTNLNELDTMTELLFYRLLPLPDDHGCFEASPKVLSGKLFPYKDEWTAEIVCRHLSSLVDSCIIQLWVENGRLFGVFVNWAVHQRIRSLHQRKTPEPLTENLNSQLVAEYLKQFNVTCRQLSSTDSGIPIPILSPIPVPTPESESEDSELDGGGLTAKQRKEPMFDKFWNDYGKKGNRKTASTAFLNLTFKDIDSIFEKLPKHLAQEQWVKNGGQYKPNATTFLNQRRWEDEIQEAGSTPTQNNSGLSRTDKNKQLLGIQ
jgi:hypothetical protein